MNTGRISHHFQNVEVYYHKDHLIYNGTSSTLPWQSPEGKKRLSKWVTTYHRLMSLLPHERDAFDFRSVLEEFGVVAGTPIPEYFPYIMRAFPKAKVILTWRDAADWRTHRTAKYPQSPFPFQYMTDSVDNWDQEALKKNRRHTLGTLMTSENKAGSELMMHMHNVLVECLTPADQLLMINPLEESQKEIEKKLARFLGSP